MNPPKSMAIWSYFTTMTIWLGLVSGNTLNLFQEGCPYTNFCTMNSTLSYPGSNDTVPCCYDCLCDEYCSLFDDCCPDVDQNENKFNGLKLKCRQARTTSTFTDSKSVDHNIPSYRFVDFCPVEYRGSSQVIEKCERDIDGNSEFENVVLVSDKQQRVFKNKHCAFCHGVLQVRSWNLNILECSKDVGEMQLALSASRSFILQNCLLVSERPSGVPVTSRTLECDNVNVCDSQNKDVKDDCLNGPYMPYVEYSSDGLSPFLHKNVLCFRCNRQALWSGLCPLSNGWTSRSTDTAYHLLLNHKMEQPRASISTQSECREHELMDPYQGKCRQLFCPPFEMVSYGKCVPLSDGISSLYIKVNIVYTLQNMSVDMPHDNRGMYNDSLLQQHLDKINSKYRYPNCTFLSIVAAVQIDKSTMKFTLLILELTYDVSQDCSMSYIRENLRQTQSHQKKESWFINNSFYDMDGQITFYKIEISVDDPKYDYQTLIFHLKGQMKWGSIRSFFICPYFILSYKEYSGYIERLDQSGQGFNLNDLTPWSTYLDGFFPLHHNEVAACAQAYLPTNACARYRIKAITLVFIALVAFVYA